MSAPIAGSSGSAAAAGPSSRSGAGEGTSFSAAGPSTATRHHGQPSRTLEDVMREPSARQPDVVVLNSLPQEGNRKETLDPKEDLWLSTADG